MFSCERHWRSACPAPECQGPRVVTTGDRPAYAERITHTAPEPSTLGPLIERLARKADEAFLDEALRRLSS